MFTGLIEYVGSVLQVRPVPTGKQLRIDLGPLSEGTRVGDSLAVDGVCLTVTAVQGTHADFDVVATTLAATTLGGFTVHSRVNLERPISLGGRLGGHLVAGHVDGLATLRTWSRQGMSKIAHFQTNRELTDFMIPRGSVALNGVSLTVASLENGAFSVALIPVTLSGTNLDQLQAGQTVNVETDLIGKYVAKLVAADRKERITMETLREQGFA